MKGIDTRHPDYEVFSKIWAKVRDCTKGSDWVKSKGETYLPKLSGQEDEEYKAYKSRAQFNNFGGRTLQISIGQLFRKNPQYEDLDDYKKNIDLSGNSIESFSRQLFKEILKTNRAGVLVDYSVDQKRPYLSMYTAETIINWKHERIGGEKKLSMVMLEIEVPKQDQYSHDTEKRWKEFYLEDGIYKTREWEEVKGDKNERDFQLIEGSEITIMRNGGNMSYIPFYPITTDGTSWALTNPPLYDIININIGHYNNSADYENMLHWTGAKTLVVKEFNEDIVPIGGTVDLGKDGDAYYLEASSDSGLKEEMRHKEELIAAMGSQLMSGRGRYIQSAETSRNQSSGEYATLADIAGAMGDGMSKALSELYEWGKKTKKEINITYNKDYEVDDIPQGKLTELIGAVQSGSMSPDTFFHILEGYELYPPGWTIEKEQSAIDDYQKELVKKRLDKSNNQVIQDMEDLNGSNRTTPENN